MTGKQNIKRANQWQVGRANSYEKTWSSGTLETVAVLCVMGLGQAVQAATRSLISNMKVDRQRNKDRNFLQKMLVKMHALR